MGRQHYDAIDVPVELSTGLAADLLPGPFAELLDGEHLPQPSSSDSAQLPTEGTTAASPPEQRDQLPGGVSASRHYPPGG